MRARLLRPLREVALVAALYGGYSLVRNLLGNDRAVAERNGHDIISLERWLHIFHEGAIQRALDVDWLMELLNTFYGLAHFLVTGGILIWLYHRRASYSFWRTAIMVTTFLALIGYALYPLMPPRLVPGSGIFDALNKHGSPWNYDQGPISQISNQYAAMPSLHVGWALWCGIALWVEGGTSRLPTWLVRVLAMAYVSCTVTTVVATGNHFILDAVGGATVLGIGLLVSSIVTRRRSSAGSGTGAPAPSEAVVTAVDRDRVGGVVATRGAGQVDGDPAEVLG